MSAPLTLWAAEPGGAEIAAGLEQSASSATPGTAGTWMYLMAIGLAMVLAGLGLIRRARANQRLARFTVEEEIEPRRERPEPRVREEIELHTLARRLAMSSSGELGALATASQTGTPLFALRTEGPQRECPKCSRRYASWMAVCPFDHASLQEPNQRGATLHRLAERRARATHQEVLPRKRCVACQRRYHAETMYCPHDGEKLVMDMRDEALESSAWRVCRGCGVDAPAERALQCGCDESRRDVMELKPWAMTPRGLPLNVCPSCRRYGAPGASHCPEHPEQVLLPETVFERHALPARGHGPQRKLCVRCHGRFSGAYSHCPRDGERLRHVD